MVPRLVLPLLLVILLSAVPTASACSLAETPPEPGVLSLLDPATGEAYDVPLTGRQLGATCELSNPFDAEGDRLAYVTRPDREHQSQVLVHDRSANQTHHVATIPTFAFQISMVGDRFLTLGQTVHLYDPANGTNETLPIDLSDHPQVVLADHLVFVLRQSDPGPTLSAYDAAEGEWRFQDRELDDRVLGGAPHIRAASTEWLLLDEYGSAVYHVAEDEEHEVDLDGGVPFGLDGAHLYYVVRGDEERQVWRLPLPDGSPERVGEPRHGLLGVAGGLVVSGTYSADGFQAPDLVGVGPAGGYDASTAAVPALAPALLLLVLAGGALLPRQGDRR